MDISIRRGVALLIGLVAAATAPSGVVTAADEAALLEMSLEDLASLDIDVTSISKSQQRAAEAAAAIAVVTAEDIRRAGATSIPEALRLVPGVQVGRIDSNSWAISIRGFQGEFATKLLVMIDGRTAYTPLFAGTFWDVQDVVLEDIARIEVIRGPGASVWGANAVNGVVNIITRPAEQTQGLLASVTAGSGAVVDGDTEETLTTLLRYGGRVSDDLHYRFYGKYIDRDDFPDLENDRGADDWDQFRTGFRADWTPGDRDQITFQGDLYVGGTGVQSDLVSDPVALQNPPAPTTSALPSQVERTRQDVNGGNLLARVSHDFGDGQNFTGHVYYDRTYRDSTALREERNTVDLELQHSLPLDVLGIGNQLTWGLGYRWLEGRNEYSTLTVQPGLKNRVDNLVSAFIQDELRFLDEELRLTLGTKLEHNDFTGFEYQPSVRLAWVPDVKHTLWSAVSRSVRTPSVVEDKFDLLVESVTGAVDIGVPGYTPIDLGFVLTGERDLDAEVMYAFEAGYRLTLDEPRITVDLAAFGNRYNRLITAPIDPADLAAAPTTPIFGDRTFLATPVPDYVIGTVSWGNKRKGWIAGGEVQATWQAHEIWRLVAGYAFLSASIEERGTGNETNADVAPHRVMLQSRANLPWDVELDQTLYWVDGINHNPVNAYWRLDLRLGWKPVDWAELALVALNVTERRHTEFTSGLEPLSASGRVPRSGYAKVTLTW